MSAPALYEGTIRHRRFAVRRREFRHRISMVYERPGAQAEATARAAAGPGADGAILALTQRRILGVGFNPVSFYFCHRADGTLHAVVAEVTSTPWRETDRYVLLTRADADADAARVERTEVRKRMHVSPFLAMDQHYVWATTRPGDTLSVHIAARDGDTTVFDATLNLRRRPLTRAGLARHALLRLRVLPLIYGHALVLAARRVPVHRHPRAGEARPS
ncbi:MAG TPA: DUF1365 family protein [Baekduia sp.]|uniref:DUF1365 family protein n=1 Tax=Baekduia sp. TaxID=2600305 RepID=UPI002D79191D|nr:DUF1365 family protein [Baekduia sp.]HET6506163.1 DUF1365 family protein [Baekduia sp.]